MEKICTNCESKMTHSDEWTLSKELARNNRRLFVCLIVSIFVWIITVGGFLWGMNDKKYIEEPAIVSGNEIDMSSNRNSSELENIQKRRRLSRKA